MMPQRRAAFTCAWLELDEGAEGRVLDAGLLWPLELALKIRMNEATASSAPSGDSEACSQTSRISAQSSESVAHRRSVDDGRDN